MTMGKYQLLSWLNAIMQTQYSTVQTLGDGVAYCQIIDALHPGCLSVFKLNLTPRYPQDNQRNIKILQQALRRLKIIHPVSFQKLAKGKFQQNITFLQWIYAYTSKNAPQGLGHYEPFQRRLQILQKQGKNANQINQYLVPTKAYNNHEWQAGQQAEEYVGEELRQQIIEQVDQFIVSLQNDIRQKMQTNWKLMHNIDRSIQQRNLLYSLLKNIDKITNESPHSEIQQKIKQIINQ